MNDERLYGAALGKVVTILYLGVQGDDLEHLLDPEASVGDWGEATCMAQQLIAEATGLVGVGDI